MGEKYKPPCRMTVNRAPRGIRDREQPVQVGVGGGKALE